MRNNPARTMTAAEGKQTTKGMRWIRGLGRAPGHDLELGRFVKQTGYATVAERAPDPADVRPAARQSETVDTGTSHIGSRCVLRE